MSIPTPGTMVRLKEIDTGPCRVNRNAPRHGAGPKKGEVIPNLWIAQGADGTNWYLHDDNWEVDAEAEQARITTQNKLVSLGEKV